MEGMGEREAATIKGMAWPASPVATGCQGNPCSTGIRWGVSPAAQMGCLRSRSGSPSGPNIWQMMTFLNPLDALIPKIPFSFFTDFGVWVTSEAWGLVLVGFRGSRQLNPFGGGGGGGPAGGLYRPPPPPPPPGSESSPASLPLM